MAITLSSTPAKTLDSGNVQRWVSIYNPLLFTFTASGSPAPSKIKIELYDATSSPATQITTNELIFDFDTSDSFTFDASPYLRAYINRSIWSNFSSQGNDSTAYVPFFVRYYEEPDSSPTTEADSNTFYGLYSASQILDKYGQNLGDWLPDIGTGSPYDVDKGKFLNAPISRVKAYKGYPFAVSLIRSNSVNLPQLVKTYQGTETVTAISGSDDQVRILPIDLSSYAVGQNVGLKLQGLSLATPVFDSLWNTANTSTGSSNSNQITLPLIASGTYNFVVDWGDGSQDTITAYNQAEVTHTYTSGGTKQIQIVGTIRGWQFNNTGDRNKLITIYDWGSLDINNTSAFYGCENLTLTTVTGVPTISGTSLSLTFRNCTSITTINNLSSWDLTSITNLSAMFQGCTSFNGDCTGWNVSSVTAMNSLFNGCSLFNRNLSSWVTSSVTNMDSLFNGCSAYNNNSSALTWNLSSLLSANSMFFGCSNFNNGSTPNTANTLSWSANPTLCTDLSFMFRNCTAFNSDCSGWDISSATTLSNTFSGCTNFNNGGATLNWTMGSNVSTIRGCFSNCTNFNQDISSWTLTNCNSIAFVFQNAESFNQDVSSWSLSNVTTFQSSFENALVFDQDLGAWDLTSLTTAVNMFDGAGMSTANYDATLIGWETPEAGTTPNNITLGASGLTYTSAGAGGTARTALINDHSWSFVGDSGV